jgi:hypothetical protein
MGSTKDCAAVYRTDNLIETGLLLGIMPKVNASEVQRFRNFGYPGRFSYLTYRELSSRFHWREIAVCDGLAVVLQRSLSLAALFVFRAASGIASTTDEATSLRVVFYECF